MTKVFLREEDNHQKVIKLGVAGREASESLVNEILECQDCILYFKGHGTNTRNRLKGDCSFRDASIFYKTLILLKSKIHGSR